MFTLGCIYDGSSDWPVLPSDTYPTVEAAAAAAKAFILRQAPKGDYGQDDHPEGVNIIVTATIIDVDTGDDAEIVNVAVAIPHPYEYATAVRAGDVGDTGWTNIQPHSCLDEAEAVSEQDASRYVIRRRQGGDSRWHTYTHRVA